MFKKIITLLKEFIGHFVIYYGVAFVCDKIWKLENSLWAYAIGMSIGWLLWEVIEYGYKNVKKKVKREVG